MTHSNQAIQDPTREPGRRARVLLVVSLLVLTVLGAWAAGVSGHSRAAALRDSASGGSASLAFSAAGGGPVHFTGQLDRGSVLANGDGIAKMELLIRADETPVCVPKGTAGRLFRKNE